MVDRQVRILVVDDKETVWNFLQWSVTEAGSSISLPRPALEQEMLAYYK